MIRWLRPPGSSGLGLPWRGNSEGPSMKPLRRTLLLCAAALSAVSCHDFDTKRIAPPKTTLGDELYGVFCDRVGASSLPEDLTGASYRSICHPSTKPPFYADAVDTSVLPPPGTALQKEA